MGFRGSEAYKFRASDKHTLGIVVLRSWLQVAKTTLRSSRRVWSGDDDREFYYSYPWDDKDGGRCKG